MTAAEETIVIDPSGAAAASFNPAQLAGPLGDATRSAYEKLAGGVEWYFEHWVDLVEEIKAEQTARLESLALSDVLAALSEAKVASNIPGRARLRLPQLKKQADLCAQVAEAIKAAPAVDSVQVSAITGSILAFYNAARYPSLDALLRAVAA